MKTDKNYSKFLILGAGVAGLGAGIKIQKEGGDSLILEKDSSPGGLNRNITLHGCDFDFGPKILLLDDSENSKEILSFLGDNFEKYPVVERTYLSQYGLLGFPLQRYLIDLPTGEVEKIIEDLNKVKNHPLKINNFKDWLINEFGEYFCNLVLFPYEKKKWHISLDQMDYKWALTRPIKIDYGEIIKGSKIRLLPNKFYYYPKNGNISVLTKAMAKSAGSILLETEVLGVNLKEKFVETNRGNFYYQHLISSLPLDYVTSKTHNLPDGLKNKSKKELKRLSILVFNLVFDGNHNLDGTAIYFPEIKYIFRRVSILQNLCPALRRDKLTPISVEISIDNKNLEIDSESILEQILLDFKDINGLKNLGLPLDWEMLRVDFAYPLQLNNLQKTVREIHDYYEKFGFYNCGRGGNFDYCNGDEAYKQGGRVAMRILQNNT